MHDTHTLASVPHPAARPGTSVRSADMLHRHRSLASLRNMIATWRERRRFRLDLEQMSKDNPHLIDDIGLTGPQARTEINKRFWEV